MKKNQWFKNLWTVDYQYVRHINLIFEIKFSQNANQRFLFENKCKLGYWNFYTFTLPSAMSNP